MDEKTAWEFFSRTGSVEDYLIYAQCKAKREKQQVVHDENGRQGPGGFREARG